MRFSTIDIERGLKISRERLREWTSKGFVKPSIPSPGQGKRAEFSRDDLLRVCLFDELLRIGFQRKVAGEIVQRESPFLWESSLGSGATPDFLMIKIFGDEFTVLPVFKDLGINIDWADGGKLKLRMGKKSFPIPRLKGDLGELLNRLHDDLEKPWDHLHIVNLSSIKARVRAAFPE
jgi:DNA-binding transcriptional MerR regulator